MPFCAAGDMLGSKENKASCVRLQVVPHGICEGNVNKPIGIVAVLCSINLNEEERYEVFHP
jgi:hypothetical protein